MYHFFTLALLFLLTSAVPSHSQNLIACSDTTTWWVVPGPDAGFALRLSGKIQTTDHKNVLAVNDFVLQYLVSDIKKFTVEGQDNSGLIPLIRHALSEGEYMSGLFKNQLNIQMEKAEAGPGRQALVWHFDFPEGMNTEVEQQVFVSMLVGDQIIGLSSSLFKGQVFVDIRDFLTEIISTALVLDKQENLQQLCDK